MSVDGNKVVSPTEKNKEGASLPNPYGKFKYTGSVVSLKNNIYDVKKIKAGVNWFISNIDEQQIEITKHLYEDNVFYLTGTGAEYENFHKVYSDALINISNIKFDTPDNLINTPLITAIKCEPNDLIYAFNEAYKLSPFMVPHSLFKTDEERKKFDPQVIAFEGLDTRYTYIFYGVDFITPEDIDSITSNKNVKFGIWNDPQDITINKYNKLISTSDNKSKTGTVILKAQNQFFGVVVFTDTFEVIDPLLLTPDIGKIVKEQPGGGTTPIADSTGGGGSSTTQPTTSTNTGGNPECSVVKNWKNTQPTSILFDGKTLNQLDRLDRFLTTSAKQLVDRYVSLDEQENILLHRQYFASSGVSVPNKGLVPPTYKTKNDGTPPYNYSELNSQTTRVNNMLSTTNQKKVEFEKKLGMKVDDNPERRVSIKDIDNIYTELVKKCFP